MVIFLKQRLNINIDSQVYLLAKSSKVNLSELINNLLLQYFQYQDTHADEAEILKELQTCKEQREEVDEKISQLTIQLVHTQEQNEQAAKEQDERAFIMLQAARNSGILEKVAGR